MKYRLTLAPVFIVSFSLLITACGGEEGSNHTSSISSLSSISSSSSSKLAQSITFEQVGPIAGQVGDVIGNPAITLSAGEIIYTASNTDVATVDSDGYVTLLSAGTVIISAHIAADSQFSDASNSYSINVGSANTVMTAWIGTEDTLINFSNSALGSGFYRTSEPDCNPINFTACLNGQFNLLTANNMVDSTARLDQTAFYLLEKNGAQSSLSVNIKKFSKRSGYQIVMFKNEFWLVGGAAESELEATSSELKNDVWSSPDGIIWTRRVAHADFSPRKHHELVVFNNQLWIFGGITNQDINKEITSDIWSSTDGIHWQQQTANPPFAVRTDHRVTSFNNKLWLVGGNDGIAFGKIYSDVWSSSDGINWTEEVTNSEFSAGTGQHKILIFNNKIWLFGWDEDFESDDIWSSADGKNWVEVNRDAEYRSIRDSAEFTVYKNKLWLVGGGFCQCEVWSSSDGISWKMVSEDGFFHGRSFHKLISFQNKMWIIGGVDLNYELKDDTWVSSDGINWSEQTTNANFKARQMYKVASFKNQLWLIGSGQITSSFNTDKKTHILSSADAMLWNERVLTNPPSPRGEAAVVAHNNQLWIVGGSVPIGAAQTIAVNDVWSSVDGNTWVEKTKSAQFPTRFGFGCISFEGKLWVVGGFVGNSTSNDVWSSIDGVSWKLETEAANFTPRFNHKLAVFNGRLWLIGDISQHLDVWSTSDGINWRQEVASANYLGSNFEVVVYDSKLWIIKEGEGWSSDDGVNWSKISNNLTDQIGMLTVHNNKLMVIGSGSNQVWTSTDGVHWRLGYRAEFHSF